MGARSSIGSDLALTCTFVEARFCVKRPQGSSVEWLKPSDLRDMVPPMEPNPTYLRALASMDERLSVLTRQRDDARAQMDNSQVIITQATRLISTLGTELVAALDELTELRRMLRERNELIESLQENQ